MNVLPNPGMSDFGLLPHERFHAWREEIALKLMHLDAATPDVEAFRADVRVMQLPRLLLSRYVTGPLDLIRTRRLVSEGDNGCSFLICTEGSIEADFDGAQIRLEVGDAALLPHHRQGMVSTRTGARSLHMRFDHAGLRQLVPARDDTVLRKVTSGHSAVSVLAGYCERVLSAESFAPPLASLASAQLRELAAHILNPASDIAREAPYGGLKAARLKAVLHAVAANLRDPALSAASVGSLLGVTPRYVQQLLDGAGLSFSQHVRDARLDAARRLLNDPGPTHLRVTDVALAVGFQDISYFNRAFRRKFGETPSAVRRAR